MSYPVSTIWDFPLFHNVRRTRRIALFLRVRDDGGDCGMASGLPAETCAACGDMCELSVMCGADPAAERVFHVGTLSGDSGGSAFFSADSTAVSLV